MLTQADLIYLPYTPDMTQAGIAYACRSLAYTYNRMGGSRFDRLRRIVSGKAAELAFRRCLGTAGVPYDNLGATPFTDPDHYDVALGGRRCDLKSFQFFEREKIRQAHHTPGYLLQALALVPVDQLSTEQLTNEDLYIFAFSTALVTRQRQEIDRARQASQPVHLIHPLPAAWAQPKNWNTLGRLALKTEMDQATSVELGGQDGQRQFQTERLILPPHHRLETGLDYWSLAYMRVSELPDGLVGVSRAHKGSPYLIDPSQWGNIWVYGMKVILAGYLTRGEFKRKARRIPAGTQVLQYNRTRTENMGVRVEELHPLERLFEKAKGWKGV